MLKWTRFFLFLFCPLSLFAFIVDPWLDTLAEFKLRSSYLFRHYPAVSGACHPRSYHSDDHLLNFNCGLRFLPSWETQLEFDFSDTKKLSWGTERIGTQLRYLVMDDVAGDPVSLTVGTQLFYVPSRNMRDVSSPYHAQGNVELGAAVGKEWGGIYDWRYRFYGFLGLGIANRGKPWLRPIVSAEMKWKSHHKLQLFSEGYFGFGRQSRIDIEQFRGYAEVGHRSVDLGANYTYLFDIWGELGIQYAYRIYARAFPERASVFKIEYRLPFSLF